MKTEPAPVQKEDGCLTADEDYHQWQSAVFTLMGHAAGLYAQGQHDMPSWLYELAEKIARVHVDEPHARRVKGVAVQMQARYAQAD